MNSSDPSDPSPALISRALAKMDVAPYAYAPLYRPALEVGLTTATTLFIAYLVGKLFTFIPTGGGVGRAPVILPRGRRRQLHKVPVHPQFHPDAPAVFDRPDDSFLRWMMWLADDVVTPAAKAIASAGLAFVVRKLRNIFSMSNIKERIAPIGTRLQRGIAQVSTLQNAFVSRTSAFVIPYRYLCPTSFLLVLFVGLVFVVGAPIGAVTWFCAGGFLLVVAGDMGASEPEESEEEGEEGEDEVDDAPLDADMNPMTDTAGLAPTVALHAQL